MLLLGFLAFAFSDYAHLKWSSFEPELRALLAVDYGSVIFSEKRDDWSLTLSGSASSTGTILFSPADEKFKHLAQKGDT
jgi:hypothetical protein